jgi:RNA polymerase sigma-70 factor (ECF subfamily)
MKGVRNLPCPHTVFNVVSTSTETKILSRELITRFRDGDIGAFEEIVRLHRRRMFVIALRRIGSVEAAEDAVQVALTSAYRHLVGLGDEVDLGAWLNRVVENAAVDQGRAEGRQKRLANRAFAAAPEREDRRGAHPLPVDGLRGLEREELGSLLRDGILSLPERYQRALDLYHLQGLPVDDVAAVLSLNVNTVKSHLARGRGLLRRRLETVLERGGYL